MKKMKYCDKIWKQEFCTLVSRPYMFLPLKGLQLDVNDEFKKLIKKKPHAQS